MNNTDVKKYRKMKKSICEAKKELKLLIDFFTPSCWNPQLLETAQIIDTHLDSAAAQLAILQPSKKE